MTGKAEFTDEEWNVIREGPPTAGVITLMASSGGTFRETWALAKSFAEARQQHGESELLDALVAEKPDLPRYHSAEEAEQQGLDRLKQAAVLLRQKASPEDLESYKQFTLSVSQRVAEAHKEGGEAVSPEEQQALAKIEAALGEPGS